MKTIILISLLLLLFSCKKDENKNPSWAVPKIKTVSNPNTNTYTNYYDQQGNIIKSEEMDVIMEYTYEPAKVSIKSTHKPTGSVQYAAYELNAEGYVTRVGNSTYSYTPEGFIKNIVTTTPNSPAEFSFYYYNAATNLLDSVVKQKGSQWSQTTVYTYLTGKNQTTGNDNMGMAYFGKTGPYPIKRATYWMPRQGFPSQREVWRIEEYNYLYNDAERIVQVNETVSVSGPTYTSVNTYTYY